MSLQHLAIQDIYWTAMHPNQSQEARMKEIMDSCYAAYCFAIDGLLSGKYVVTEETLYDVIDKQMKSDWIDVRPPKAGPWTTMRYMIRMACHNWMDEVACKDREYLAAYLKHKHENQIYIPHSGMPLKDSVQIERVCRVPIDPIDIPTRIHLVVAHWDPIKQEWRAEVRAALKDKADS